MGQRCSVCAPNHFCMHCKWKACPHVPHTTGLSSPGNLLSGGHPSKGFLQMPHRSSPASHVHTPTACQRLISTLNDMVCLCCNLLLASTATISIQSVSETAAY
eukprot:GHRR01003781.1.p1 GENE.GHRR01003781.1~~GHRR01003781.1.p1  ORF type:complete len:103 (-),score=0.41 GHRR01003781.1:353-661(-)